MPANTWKSLISAYETGLLDEINRRLLEELQADARLSMAELGRRVSLSAPAVAERVQRLEAAGVTTGYRVELYRARWLPIGVTVASARTRAGLTRFWSSRGRSRGRRAPSHHRRGCLSIELHLRSIDDLEEIIDRFLPYGRTTTSIMQSAPIPRRPLPLGGTDRP